jgi:hypothetical protein
MRLRRMSALAAAALAGSAVLPLAVGDAAGTPPVATTGSASAVSQATAVLNGTVNPSGSATTYSFQYGTTPAYGSQTGSVSAGSGTAAVPASVTIGGLAANTSYHFRIVASSSGGTTNGTDATLTTGKAPPAVTHPAAANVTSTSVTLSAAVNPNTEPTTYVFQYGTNTSYGHQTASASVGGGSVAVAVSQSLGGLAPGTTYHCRIVAVNATGTTASGDLSFTTVKAPPTATTGAATLVMSGSALVTGTVNPQGLATTYEFQYGPTTSYGHQTAAGAVGSGSANVGAHVMLTNLAGATPYHYRLVAVNPDGTTAGADRTLITTGTPAARGALLPVVSHGASAYVSSHSVQLNGALNPPAPGTHWYFQYGPTTAYGAQTPSQTLPGLGARPINAKIAGLEGAVRFHYRLVAVGGGALYYGPDHTFTTKVPARTRPLGLSLTVSSIQRLSGLRVSSYGRLRLPGSVLAAAGCTGQVEVQIERGADTISLRTANLRSNCSYREGLRFSDTRSFGGGSLRVRVHFTGNAVLLPAYARSVAVRV